MKTTLVMLAVCLCAALVESVPIAKEGFQSKTLDRLMVVEADNESALRSKRTIGLLRQLFPEVSKMIDDKVNLVVGEIFKIFGPVVIQGILGGNKNPGNRTEAGTTVNAENPFGDEETGNDGNFKSFVDDDDFFAKPKDNEIESKIPYNEASFVDEKELKTITSTIGTAKTVTGPSTTTWSPPKTTITAFVEETPMTTTEENITQGPADPRT